MNKLKELWSYPVFRYFVLVIVISVPTIPLLEGLSIIGISIPYVNETLEDAIFWVMIVPLILIFWVWRKPLIRFVLRLGSFLNRAADDDSK
jgi:hypothetical protein